MNILLTGSKGFVGKNILKTFSKSYKIFSLQNGSKYIRTKKKIICNLLKKDHINMILKEDLIIDVIIHTASKLSSVSNMQSKSILQENILMYEHLSIIINKFDPKQVINLSSTAVYPNKDGVYTETSEIKPSENNDCYYGISKIIGENILDFKCKKSKILNLRVAQIYGPGMRKDRVYEIMKKDLIKKNTIFVYGMGRRVSGFIHIDSLIKKIKICINKKLCGIFNIADSNLSYKQLALKIIKEFGNKKSKIKLLNSGLSNKTFINFSKFRKIEKNIN